MRPWGWRWWLLCKVSNNNRVSCGWWCCSWYEVWYYYRVCCVSVSVYKSESKRILGSTMEKSIAGLGHGERGKPRQEETRRAGRYLNNLGLGLMSRSNAQVRRRTGRVDTGGIPDKIRGTKHPSTEGTAGVRLARGGQDRISEYVLWGPGQKVNVTLSLLLSTLLQKVCDTHCWGEKDVRSRSQVQSSPPIIQTPVLVGTVGRSTVGCVRLASCVVRALIDRAAGWG